MPDQRQRRVLALADDLSGAAETAAGLLARTTRNRVVLDAGRAAPREPGETTVVDLDCRHLPAAEATRRARAALAAGGGRDAGGALVLAKVDSLLRGNLAALARVLTEDGHPAVATTALPVAGRVVRDSTVHLRGVPLHETDAWRVEPTPPPRSLAAAFAPVPVAPVALRTVRTGHAALVAAFRAATAAGRMAVPDAESDADLDAIAAAALAADPATRLIGTGGIAGALGRHLGRPGAGALAGPPPEGDRPLLVVVGSAEPTAAEQAARLAADGATPLLLPLADPPPGRRPPSPALPMAGTTVLTIGRAAAPHPAPRALVARLAAAVAGALAAHAARGAPPADLVLTGGETGRRVLDALGVRELEPVGQIHHGAVHQHPDGRSIVTRPGSYGGPDSLLRIV
uniref:four-carbon acid sugar kinase family protein n=1 Tax=Streptomyces sp. SBT349 TaxID=1580539 RepID=UPI00069D4DAB